MRTKILTPNEMEREINSLTDTNKELLDISKGMYELLVSLIKQKAIGNMALDVGKLNDVFMRFERITKNGGIL